MGIQRDIRWLELSDQYFHQTIFVRVLTWALCTTQSTWEDVKIGLKRNMEEGEAREGEEEKRGKAYLGQPEGSR